MAMEVSFLATLMRFSVSSADAVGVAVLYVCKMFRHSSAGLQYTQLPLTGHETLGEGTWLCEIAIWTQWWHRGQLSAQGACP